MTHVIEIAERKNHVFSFRALPMPGKAYVALRAARDGTPARFDLSLREECCENNPVKALSTFRIQT
jgi:hypothetical protein